jgi:hypothetical protein
MNDLIVVERIAQWFEGARPCEKREGDWDCSRELTVGAPEASAP